MAAASPAFTYTGASGSLARLDTTAGATVTATLDNLAGVGQVTWSVVGTDDTGGTYTLTPSGSLGSVVTFTAGAAGTAGGLKCTVNAGLDVTGAPDATLSAVAKWSVPTAGSLHVGFAGENQEHSSTYGWTGIVNAGIRAASAAAAGTFPDNTFRVYGSSDATKLAAFEVDGFTTATTRTFTLPNATGTVTLDGFASTFSAIKTFGDGFLAIAGSSSGTTVLKATAAASGTITFPAATGTVTLNDFASTFSAQKTFNDSTLVLAGSSSGGTTLKAAAAAGTTVATFQGTTGTVAYTADFGTISDGVFTVQDDGDATKQWAVSCGSITAGNKRTLTIPDSSGTITLNDFASTFSAAKTFNDSTLVLAGSTSGAMTVKAPAAASTYVATFPAATGTVSFIDNAESITGTKTFGDGKVVLSGSTSGTTTVKANATAGSTTATFQAASGIVAYTTDPVRVTKDIFGKTSADGSAGATFGELILWRLTGSGTITAGHLLPNGSATANDTNYAQVIYTRYNSSNVSQGVMFTQTTVTTGSGGGGNIVANQPWTLGTAANNTYSDGDYVTVTISKPGTGVTLPSLKFSITLA